MSEADVKLFEAPDLSQLQRNWPRIALRASVLVSVPVLVALLAKTLGLYSIVAGLPLGLDFLALGPFAYEAKLIAAIVFVLLGLAFLVPKRTSQLVIAICVGGVLWTGHVFITLQWARLFATNFRFREESVPGALAWIYATLLLTIGVVYLLLENLLETRAQQEARKLAGDETRMLFEVSAKALGLMLAVGFGIAAALGVAYLGLRALLLSTELPFRLNPVFVLFGMGVALAVLVALAAQKRSPTDFVMPAPAPVAAAPSTAPLRVPPVPGAVALPPVEIRDRSRGRGAPAGASQVGARVPTKGLSAIEWIVTFVGAIAALTAFMTWSSTFERSIPGVAYPGGLALVAGAIATPVLFLRAKGWTARYGALALWLGLMVAAMIQTIVLTMRSAGGSGAYLGTILALATVIACVGTLVPSWRSARP